MKLNFFGFVWFFISFLLLFPFFYNAMHVEPVWWMIPIFIVNFFSIVIFAMFGMITLFGE